MKNRTVKHWNLNKVLEDLICSIIIYTLYHKSFKSSEEYGFGAILKYTELLQGLMTLEINDYLICMCYLLFIMWVRFKGW